MLPIRLAIAVRRADWCKFRPSHVITIAMKTRFSKATTSAFEGVKNPRYWAGNGPTSPRGEVPYSQLTAWPTSSNASDAPSLAA